MSPTRLPTLFLRKEFAISSMKSFACWNSVGVMLPEESSRKAMSMMLSQASISGKKGHNRISFVLSCGFLYFSIAHGDTEQYQEWKYIVIGGA